MFVPDLIFWLILSLLAVIGWQRGLANRWMGRLGLLLLLSPGLRYVSTVFGFELRLALSALAGSLMQLAGLAIRVEGNVLIRPGPSGEPMEMAVDPACMGLHLTGLSMVVAVAGLIWVEQQTKRQVALGWVLTFGIVAFGLTLVCNLVRIVLLVGFHIVPADPLHELAGLVCVLVYSWLPSLGLAWLMVNRLGQLEETRQRHRQWVSSVVSLGVLMLLVGACWAINRPATVAKAIPVTPKPGYQARRLTWGFVQYDRPGTLIYQKTLPDWWSAEHSPTACWRGAGYTLTHIRQTTLNNHPAYVGQLQRGSNVLFTAWWFSNGQQYSISQWAIRIQMVRGEPAFSLVNVTVEDEKKLADACRDATYCTSLASAKQTIVDRP